MENIAGKIEWYHNLYLACLSGASVFLALSVILFIRLDIRGVIGFFTGRQAERGIRELEQNGGKNKESRKHIKPELPKKYIIEKSGEPQRRKIKNFSEAEATKRLSEEAEGSKWTVPLYQEMPDFCVEREILLVHTDETII